MGHLIFFLEFDFLLRQLDWSDTRFEPWSLDFVEHWTGILTSLGHCLVSRDFCLGPEVNSDLSSWAAAASFSDWLAATARSRSLLVEKSVSVTVCTVLQNDKAMRSSPIQQSSNRLKSFLILSSSLLHNTTNKANAFFSSAFLFKK
jgi:hypothetical protein